MGEPASLRARGFGENEVLGAVKGGGGQRKSAFCEDEGSGDASGGVWDFLHQGSQRVVADLVPEDVRVLSIILQRSPLLPKLQPRAEAISMPLGSSPPLGPRRDLFGLERVEHATKL